MKFNRSVLGWVTFVGLAILLLSAVYHHLTADSKEMSQTEFWNSVKNGSVAEVNILRNKIDGELRPDSAQKLGRPARFFVKMDTEAANQEWFQQRLDAGNVKVNGDPGGSWWTDALPTVLVYGVLILLVWFFFLRQFRAAGGGSGILGNFGRSRHRMTTKEHTNVTFDDVAGIEEAKEEVREIIEFLKNPRKFQRLGARIPRGVLLVGDPGCGKTLLAKAIAGEAEVPFFSISGSDFVEMFVGVGASRVRDLFKQAKENSPCIIFLDEIDAVGRRRGAGFNGGGHDEREQTLNAILVEMDGFDTSDQIIVIAATNRVDVLDPALTRPGRFDRQVNVPLPDIKGRVDILKIYAAKVKTGPDVDLHRLARGTPMFSGADLAALINEAAIAATLSEKEFIEQADLEEARDKVRWGRQRKSRVIDEQEKTVTAYHEAGHALVQMLNPNADPLHKVSIIPRGPTGGATFSLPEKDRYLYTKKYCRAMLEVCMGGRLAEKIFCDDISSGAAMDIHQATSISRRMVLDWGMSERLGMVRYAPDEHSGPWAEMTPKEYSDATAEVIDEEVRRITDEANQSAEKLILSNRDKLERLAQALMKYETLDGDEVAQILDGRPLNRPSMTDLLETEQKRVTTPKKRTDSRPATEGPGVDIAPNPA